MLIEQPRQLNKYVDSTIPLTWEVRWRIIKPSFPLMIYVCVQAVELVAFRLWLSDRNLLENLPLLLASAMAILSVLCVVFELLIRTSHCSKRRLKIGRKAVWIKHTKDQRIPWKYITAWQLEPLADAPG